MKDKLLKICLYLGLYLKGKIDILNGFFVLKNRKKIDSQNSKIKVVFYSQMPTLWSNVQELYNKMILDDLFEVYILAIPEPNYFNINFKNEKLINKAYEYHLHNNNFILINAFENGKWFDLKFLKPQYVFFERPYNYIPSVYRIENVSRYSKTCYIPYGLDYTNKLECIFPISFFSYLYISFASSCFEEQLNYKRFRFSHKVSLRKTVLLEHPIYTKMLDSKTKESYYFKNDDQTFKVVWTPRWTMDEAIFKSNFFNYKDQIINYFINEKDMSIIFRPHPLAFDNFIEKKLMTKQEVDDYLSIFYNNNNFIYDNQEEYFSTFWNSDVLVTDYSGIIPVYFVTGKPIILCDATLSDYAVDILKEIIDVSYVVNSWEEVETILKMLKNGNDPLKEKRIMCRNKFLNNDMIENIPINMINYIKDDYFGQLL